MGTHSAIARRLSPEIIQYGNVINDGYLDYVGCTLACYYDSPESVEQLFSLGQLESLGAPGTENKSCILDLMSGTFCTRQMNGYYPHEICKGENNIDPKIIFTDYYYIYELDKKWYYIKPGRGMQKIPLSYVIDRMQYLNDHPESRPEFLKDNSNDLCVRYEMDMAYIKEILFEYPKKDMNYKRILDSSEMNIEETYDALRKEEFPLSRLFEQHAKVLSYFDSWSVFVVDECTKPPAKVLLRKKTDKHEETYLWKD